MNEANPWDVWQEVGNQPSNNQQISPSQVQANPWDVWEEVGQTRVEEPSLDQELGGYAKSAARGAVEGLASVPNAVEKMIEPSLNRPEGYEPIQQEQLQELPQQLQGVAKDLYGKPAGLTPSFPSQDEIKEFSDSVFGKTYSEKARDIGSEAAQMAAFGGGTNIARSLPGRLAASLGITLAGNGAKEIADKGFNLSEGKQELAKVATELALSIYNPTGAAVKRAQLYETFDKEAAKANPISSSVLLDGIKDVRNTIRKENLGSSQSAKIILSELDSLESKLYNPDVSAEQIKGIGQSISEFSQGLFNQNLGKPGTKNARRLAQVMRDKVFLKGVDALEQTSPQAAQALREANSFNAVYETQNRFTQFVESVKGNLGKHGLAGVILHSISPSVAAVGAAGVAATGLFRKAQDVVSRIMADPTAKKLYTMMIGEGLKENLPNFQKLLLGLEHKLQTTLPKELEDKKVENQMSRGYPDQP